MSHPSTPLHFFESFFYTPIGYGQGQRADCVIVRGAALESEV